MTYLYAYLYRFAEPLEETTQSKTAKQLKPDGPILTIYLVDLLQLTLNVPPDFTYM